MRQPLTPEERQTLTDPGRLAQATAAGPFELRDRTLSNLKISDLVLDHPRFIDVDFLNVEFVGTRFKNAVFDTVVFKKCRLEQVAFHSSTISRWALEQSGLNQSQFDRCELRSSRAVNAEMVEVTFQDCLIERFENIGGSFERPSFVRVRFVGPQWRSTTFRHPRLEVVSFENGDLRDVAFSESQCRELMLRRMNVEGLAFQFGELVNIGLEGIRGGTVGLADLSCHGLRLTAGDLAALNFAGVSGAHFTVERCPVTTMMMIYSEIDNLQVSHCNLADVSIRKSRVSGQSFFEGCTIATLDLSESQLEGLAIRDTTLNRRLNVRGATHHLPLQQVEAPRSSLPLDSGTSQTLATPHGPVRLHGDSSSIAHDVTPIAPAPQVARFQPSSEAKSESASGPAAAHFPPQSPPQQLPTQKPLQKVPPLSPFLKASVRQPRPGATRPHLMLNPRVLAGGGALAGLLSLMIGYSISRPRPAGHGTVRRSMVAPTKSSPLKTQLPETPELAPREPVQPTTPAASVKPAPEESRSVSPLDRTPAHVDDRFASSPVAAPFKTSLTTAPRARRLAGPTNPMAQATPAEPPRKPGRSRPLQRTHIPIE